MRVSRLTAAMDGRASPRKPRVVMDKRSASAASLLVAWRLRLRGISSGVMPAPSSTTRMSRRPPSSTATVMVKAPASRAFSTSSLTAAAGRVMTSPAAILAATWGSRIRMRLTDSPLPCGCPWFIMCLKEGCLRFFLPARRPSELAFFWPAGNFFSCQWSVFESNLFMGSTWHPGLKDTLAIRDWLSP